MEALGIVETKGLLAAIEGADVMLKSADVRLLDKTYVGAGLVSITVTGDVAAVQASVSAAVSALGRLDGCEILSSHVIPRPDESIGDKLFGTGFGSGCIGCDSNAGSAGGTEEQDIETKEIAERITSEESASVAAVVEEKSEPEVASPAAPVLAEQDAPKAEVASAADAPKKVSAVKPAETAPVEKKHSLEIDKAVQEVLSPVPTAKKATSTAEQKKVEPTKAKKAKVVVTSKEEMDALWAEQGTKKAIAILTRHTLANLRKLAVEYPELPIEHKNLSKVKKRTLMEAFNRYYNSLKK